ncbi:uncharacterized protein LOC108742716 [Agrilus planipennis]|uniref:Uncharacterized protein LOC108742716 n=1 Tax=Agrilus planipennis TaxID=224129 RepID=A0A7F5RK73_AGRPL|nr:uncharacterized protein LOC108742716 [Agrilus planipennis]
MRKYIPYVTWYKTSDGLQLTYRNVNLINDRRFSVQGPEIITGNDKFRYVRWDLLIALVNPSDEGSYECWAAISSERVEKWTVHLRVIEAKAEILGDPQKVFKVGSTLRLSCYVEDEYEDPEYIFWYHRDRMINFDMTNGINIRIGRLGSELVAPRAEFYHSGNYSCVPSNARPANVTVYVYKDNLIPTPPATDNGNRNFRSFSSVALSILTIIVSQMDITDSSS